MDWKDTVMSLEQLNDLEESENIVAYDPWVGIEAEELRKVAKAQAKITGDIAYNVGRDSFLDDVGNATIPLSEVYKRGMVEVVEWLGEHPRILDELRDVLPDKLKEWGLK